MHFEDPSSPPFQNWHPQTPLSPTNTLPWHHFYQFSSSSSWFTTMIIMIQTTYILWWGVHDLPKHSIVEMLDCAHVQCTKPLIGQNVLFWELSKESLVHQSCRWFLDQQTVLDKNCIHHNFAFFLKDSLVWWSLALHGCFGDFFRGKETPCVPYHKICRLVTFGESTEVIQMIL